MRLTKAWIIANKDLKVFRRKGSLLRYVVLFPLLAAIGLPLVIHLVISRNAGLPPARLEDLLSAFGFFFVIISSYVPIVLASYSFVGEKVERSLEPLLATPITDGELFLGKAIAAFIPTIAAIWISASAFMVLADAFTRSPLGYLFYPNGNIALILLLLVPLTIILTIVANVIISSRANDVRAAQTQGVFIVIPYAAIYVSTEVGIIQLNTVTLLLIAAVIVAVAAVLFSFSSRLFQREEILTRWT